MANLSNINNKLIVTDGGQVLVNQTAAGFNADADDLIVGNLLGNTGITIASGSNVGDYGSIYFADGTGSGTPSKAGYIRYEQNTSKMTIGINAVEKVAIDVSGNTTFSGTVTTTDVYGASSLRLAALGGIAYLDSGSGSSVIIRTNGTTTALTLDSSQNATFAGNITATTAGTTTVNSVSTGDWAGMQIQSSDAASAYLFFRDTSGERARIQSTASNDLKFSTNGGGSLALTLDSSTNATFAGTVSGGNGTFTQVIAPNGFLGGATGANGGIRIHSGGTKFFNITSANAARDGIMDIGASDARFKDLWLSGAVTGGTISCGAITTSGIFTSTLAINQASLPNAANEHVISLNPPTTTAYYGGGISWCEGAAAAASLGVYDAGSGGALGFYIATGNNTTLTQALTIDSSQKVGIGLTGPTAKLHVFEPTANTGVTLKVQSYSWDATLSLINDQSTWEILNDRTGLGTNGTLAFYNGGYRMAITPAGNVGIGTTSPTQLLHVNSSTNNPTGIGLQNSERYYAVRSNNYSLVFSDETVGLERMRIDSSGNVGINYTGPFNQVSGSNETTLAVSNVNAATIYLNNTAAAGHNHAIFSGSSGNLSFYDVDNAAYSIVIDNTGDVGIGTTAPNEKFEVKGNIRIDSRSKAGSGEIDNITFTKDRPDASTGTYEMGAIRSFTTNGYSGGMTFYSGRHTGGGSYALIAALTIGDPANIGPAVVIKNGDTTSARIYPETDNAGYLGESTHRWEAVYAVNGSIQTSDRNQKTLITKSDLGLDFILKLEPVSYKWKVGGWDIKENGEDKEPTKTPIEGKRNHYGLIAQQVKEVIGDKDFGGWVKEDLEDEASIESLRYAEFISPMIKAIQELKADNDTLKARIETLENK